MTHAYIVVHGGAGEHNPKYDEKVRQALRLACKKGINRLDHRSVITSEQVIQENARHLEMVEHAISTLEDDPHLNAGLFPVKQYWLLRLSAIRLWF